MEIVWLNEAWISPKSRISDGYQNWLKTWTFNVPEMRKWRKKNSFFSFDWNNLAAKDPMKMDEAIVQADYNNSNDNIDIGHYIQSERKSKTKKKKEIRLKCSFWCAINVLLNRSIFFCYSISVLSAQCSMLSALAFAVHFSLLYDAMILQIDIRYVFGSKSNVGDCDKQKPFHSSMPMTDWIVDV